jgi:thioredoxin 1
MSNTVIELSKANFVQEVLAARRPVLVQFWAGWSEPCKAMRPFLESVAEDNSTTVKVGRVNVEHCEDLAEEYGIRAVPTLLIFKQGGLHDQLVGRATEQEVREKLERFK